MWPDADKTVELLARARAGDSSAANQLLERHRRALRRMIDLRLDPAIAARLDASDIVQETLLDASRRLRRYLEDPPMPFHLWVRQIARDRIVDAHRHHRVAQQRSVDRERRLDAPGLSERSSFILLESLVAGGLTPSAEAVRKELRQRFDESLEQLSETDREVLIMRHFEQLSNKEVATALALTEPAASMRYLRALEHLRDVFTSDEPTPGDES